MAKTGHLTITKEKKGQDKHPRNIYHIAKRFLRRHPDKRSKHYNAAAWKRWCEIGRKRAITIKLKQKKTGTIRDTAAEMATRPVAASASPTPAVQLTPAQARDARRERGGGFDALGDALKKMGLLGGPTPSQATTADTYTDELKKRGDMLQRMREQAAQPSAAMPTTPTTTAGQTASPWPWPAQARQARRQATQDTERKAQAYDELQSLRERLRQQAAPPAPADGTAGAWQDVARDYRRASRTAASPSRWPATTTQPVQLIQTIQQPAAIPAVEQDARATRDYWKRKLREHEAQQQAAAAMGEAR
jgi:hypothetical protein